MLGVRDAIAAMRQVLVMEERIGRLAREVAAQAKDVNQELADTRREVSNLRDRVSRMEGAFAVIQRLQPPGA